MSIRILLADDHNIVRHSLCRALQQEADIEVIGQADNGMDTVEMAREMTPDVVVMDIGMPDLNGIEATRQISRETKQVKVIGLSMHAGNKYVREMFRAGAAGYLLKNAPLEELVKAIEAVCEGKTYVSPAIGDLVVHDYVSTAEKDEAAFTVLSERERQVLQLLAEGHTTKSIGMRLHISPKTVEAHRLRIMNKLHIDNVPQLTKYAIQEGLTMLEQ